jgi:hypothetical protein
MATSSSSNFETKSRAAVQVAEWKREVQSFFDDDWSRLRTLIMDLEEQLWDDSSTADSQVVDTNAETKSRSNHRFNSSAAQLHHSQQDIEPKPIVKDRLTELAEQIERRLQTVHVDGK